MGGAGRGARAGLAGTVVVAVLLLACASALGQTTSTAPSVTAPARVSNVEDFEHRAKQWVEARRRVRQKALMRAQQLAAVNRSTTTTTTAVPRPTTTTTTAVPRPTTTTTTAAPRPTTTTTTAAPRPTTTTTTTTTSTAPSAPEAEVVEHPIPEGTTEAQWHALRECESTQNYRAVSSSGRYRGAYQFSVRTWDWVAEMHYPDLLGVDPRDASPADQDKMAYRLYEINGWDPWPTCKRRLPS